MPAGFDGRGAYIRSTTPVTSNDACWRVPVEGLSSAILVKAPAWFAWDCPGGSFWDGYSPNGPSGSCWRCPDDYPRRTLYSVFATNACATPINQTTKAIFLAYNGCPKPDASTMELPASRLPGRPFLNVAAGGAVSSSNGACYACPIADSEGNFLIADRNLAPLYDKDNNTGCTIKFKWKPASFFDPGLAYMPGVKEVVSNRSY